MKIPIVVSFVLCAIFSNQGCEGALKNAAPVDHGPFGDYWFQGKAEVNSYSLEQERYKEMRKGDAIMVFVTEDFSKKKQVKLDYPDQAAADKITVIKNNALRRFKTGIYDYSLMASVFTPVDLMHFPHSLKADASVQDWCGQVYAQLNLRGSGYDVHSYSYFEKEGDQDFRTENALLEEEIFNRIRINPEALPVGEVTILPSLFYTRLQHEPLKPQSATLSLEDIGLQRICILRYTSMNRTLKITFQKDFPYRINGWEEDNGDGFITKAKLVKSIRTAYWEQHSHEFDSWRDTLGL